MLIEFYRTETRGRQRVKITHRIQVLRKVSHNGSLLYVDNIHIATYHPEYDTWVVQGSTVNFDGWEVLDQ